MSIPPLSPELAEFNMHDYDDDDSVNVFSVGSQFRKYYANFNPEDKPNSVYYCGDELDAREIQLWARLCGRIVVGR